MSGHSLPPQPEEGRLTTPAELVEQLTQRPDWRDPNGYFDAPARTHSLQWYGFEFARRHPRFPVLARGWIEAADPSNRAQFHKTDLWQWSMPTQFAEALGFARVELGPRVPSKMTRCEGIEWYAEANLPDRVTLVFDLREPVDAQLQRAGDTLRQSQRHAIDEGHVPKPAGFKIQREKLPLYLRMLDAEHAGYGPADVAKALNADRKAVVQWMKAARNYLDTDRISYLLSQAMPTRAK